MGKEKRCERCEGEEEGLSMMVVVVAAAVVAVVVGVHLGARER